MKRIIELVQKKGQEFDLEFSGIYTFINPYSYMLLRKSSVISKFDRIFVDGILLVKLFNVFGISTKRKSFDMTSLAPQVFDFCIKNKLKIYFIGSTHDSINSFIEEIKKSYSELNIIGYRNGYFLDGSERNLVVNTVRELNPDFVIAGMGTPYQEEFLIQLKTSGWKGSGYTCGGFIHQTAKGIKYYPKFYNKYNLRWLYRMIDEPKLIKRYFFQYPKSIFLFLFDMIRYFSKQRKKDYNAND